MDNYHRRCTGEIVGMAPKLVGGLGFEPRYTESESVVLPLDDPPEWPLGDNILKNICYSRFLRGRRR